MRRVEALYYELNEKFANETIEKTPYYINRRSTLEEKRKAHWQIVQSYQEKKKEMRKKIKLAEMSNEKRFNKLKPEQNINPESHHTVPVSKILRRHDFAKYVNLVTFYHYNVTFIF